MSAAPSNKGESGLSGRSVNEHNFVILLQVTIECRTNNIIIINHFGQACNTKGHVQDIREIDLQKYD